MQLHVVLLYKTHEYFNLAKGHNCTQSTLINLRFHLAKGHNCTQSTLINLRFHLEKGHNCTQSTLINLRFHLGKGHNCTQSTLINLRFHLAKRDNSFYTVNTSVGTECNHFKSQTGVVTKWTRWLECSNMTETDLSENCANSAL